MKTLDFNMNDWIRVQVNDKGKEYLASLGISPEEDKDGWSRWQLWDFMMTFGPILKIGFKTPVDTAIKLEI